MDDKRLIRRLTDYWSRLRKNLPLPAWEQFNVGALTDVWGQCCVWRVELSTADLRIRQYTYEYVGSSAQEALGQNPTGMVFLSHFQRFPGARIAKRIDEVIELKIPLTDEGQFVNERNKAVKYRSCLLPFGTSDGKVTRVVLGLSWKAN